MNKIKRYIVTTVMALAMMLPIIQPLAVHAEETGAQVIKISGNCEYVQNGYNVKQSYSFTGTMKEGYSVVAALGKTTSASGEAQAINFLVYKDNTVVGSIYNSNDVLKYCNDNYMTWVRNTDNKLDFEISEKLSEEGFTIPTFYYTKWSKGGIACSISWSGFKLFDNIDDARVYIASGSTSGLVEPPKTGLDKEWYLKNIGYSVRAEDGGENEDATFIKFTWDTDNLQDGDLIEIKTHNWYRTLTGSQYSGFHDYVTFSNGVSAMNGSYEISQYDATNAWFKSLDNTPLVFKSFDTDTYYLRPYRNGVYGGWVRISMKRNPAIKGTPYVNNVEYGDFDEETGDFVIDSDRTQTEGGYGITQKGEPVVPDEYDGLNNVGTVITTAGDTLKYFFSNITSIMGLFGQLPQLLNAVIGWLPSPLIVLICASVVVVIILRIFGR